MQIVSVARKPMEKSTPMNCVYFGTGALNIDPCRVETQEKIKAGGAGMLLSHIRDRKPGQGSDYEQNPGGRWPSNVILSHSKQCKSGYCITECPVQEMDLEGEKAGIHQAGNKKVSKMKMERNMFRFAVFNHNPDYYGDTGGASRFFKCVKEDNMDIPQELLDYLITMISPPEMKAIYSSDISTWQIGEQSDNSCPGLVAYGQPSEEQAADIKRVLMPGAHLLLIAPDSEPTGHTGTCRIEDAGFEIRDSILWVREAGNFYYVPKAARSEREAGCEKHEAKDTYLDPQQLDPERKEGDPGGNNPRNRGVNPVRNYHPTIKPIKLMERLLEDAPKDQGPILDCFMGSGSTGIACLRTGHDFIGVEREIDYVGIATSRVRYWGSQQGYVSRIIESDYKPEVIEQEPIDLWDMED